MKENKERNSKKQDDDFLEEDSDKRVIVFLSIAILVIIGIIIGLLVGCKKEEQTEEPGQEIKIPTTDGSKEDVVEETEEVETVTTTVVKTTTKTETKKSYYVTFYYNDNMNSYRVKVEEGKTVNKFIPEGFNSCNYYNDSGSEFNFNNKITSNTDVILDCSIEDYTIVYDVQTNNPTTYNVLDGEIALADYTVLNKIFDGWYSDAEFTNKVTSLNSGIASLADTNKVVHLYAKVIDSYSYKVYNDVGTQGAGDEVTEKGQEITLPSKNDNVCTLGGNHLGWTTSLGNKTIEYGFSDVVEMESDLSIYPVCGSAVVIYKSETETKEVGYTEEELDEYEVPTTDDLGLETPTYFVPVEEQTDTSKEVVENDRTYIADNQVKIEEVENKAAEGYTPSVGDNVEEYEKEFDKWTTEDTDTESETFGEQIEVPEDFTPPADETTEVEAVWIEPIPYEPPEI